MARRVEEIKRVRRDIVDDTATTRENMSDNTTDMDRYEEEYYDVSDTNDDAGLNTASGVLALALLALAIYLVWITLT